VFDFFLSLSGGGVLEAGMKTAIVNLGTIVNGEWRNPITTGDSILMDPLGMLYMITYLASLSDMPVESAIAAATGNNARVYRLNSGFLKPGCDADVVVLDACLGGSKKSALDALRNGDIPAVAAVVTDGVPRFVGRSRNTPAPIKKVRVVENRVLHDFSQISH